MASEIKNNNEGETLEREDSNSKTNLKPTSQAPKSLCWTAILLPENFKKELSNFNGESCFKFFNRDWVFLMSVYEKDEKKVQELYEDFQQLIIYPIQSGTLIIDNQECVKKIKEINNYINNGLGMNLKYYYQWFIQMSAIIKSCYNEDGRIQLNMNARAYEDRTTKELHHVFFFAASNPKLLEEPQITSLCELADIRIQKWLKRQEHPIKETKRSPFTKSIRYEVFKKSGFKCVFCGATNKDYTLHIDHIIPVSQGGTDELDNLQTLCEACNLSKKNRILTNES